MKYLYYAAALIIFSITLQSCNSVESTAEERANEICDCLVESGFNKNIAYSRLYEA